MFPRELQFTTGRMLMATMWCAVAFAMIAAAKNAENIQAGHFWLAVLSVPMFGAAVGALWGHPVRGALIVASILVGHVLTLGIFIGLLFVLVIAM